MKKIITATLTLCALTTVHAQTPSGNEADVTTENHSGASYGHLPAYSINIKAVRNLYDRYGNETNATWYTTAYGCRAKFSQDGISFMADYNKKGDWTNTFKAYDETRLPKDIRQKVRQEYFDYQIFFVQECIRPNETVYLIKIEDKSKWMTLRVTDDSMQVMETYEKNSGK